MRQREGETDLERVRKRWRIRESGETKTDKERKIERRRKRAREKIYRNN